MTLGIDFSKVASGEVNNTPFLREIGSTKMPVVLSTGMSNLGEVERAYNILIEAGTPKISLLHCTTNYPCPMDEVNLIAMVTLRDAFKCKVGYSDHTEGIEISIAAVALGAEIIEKSSLVELEEKTPTKFRESVTGYIFDKDQDLMFSFGSVDKSKIKGLSHFDLTVDTKSDLEYVRRIWNELYNNDPGDVNLEELLNCLEALGDCNEF